MHLDRFNMTQQLFAVREESSDGIIGYAVIRPSTTEITSDRSFKDGYMNRPLTLDKDAAENLANALTVKNGKAWMIELAPNACPSCGRDKWANDHDFLYPQNREKTEFRAGCNVHDGGCGHEITGTSLEETLKKWNEPKRSVRPNNDTEELRLQATRLHTAIRHALTFAENSLDTKSNDPELCYEDMQVLTDKLERMLD